MSTYESIINGLNEAIEYESGKGIARVENYTMDPDPDQIIECESKKAFYSHIAQSADDIKNERVEDADDLFDSLKQELEALKM